MLWHQILGYIIENSPQALQGKGMIDFTMDFDLFEHCIYWKHIRVRFAFGAKREKGIWELIHSDVWTYAYSIIR